MKINQKVLLYDIETTPHIIAAWGLYEVNSAKLVEERHLLSFSYKWLGEKKAHVYSLPDFKGYSKDKKNDEKLVKKLHEVLNEADIVIGHNSNSFDNKLANTFFLRHKLPPPKPFKTVDTLRCAKSIGNFNSNSLNNLSEELGLGKKVATGGIDLWFGCMSGNMSDWKLMTKYNKMDVMLLEKLYLRLRPYMTNHPLLDTDSCTCKVCGSEDVEQRGYTYTATQRRKKFRCRDCGHWSSGKIDKVSVKMV